MPNTRVVISMILPFSEIRIGFSQPKEIGGRRDHRC
jgi:hypothetical protein